MAGNSFYEAVKDAARSVLCGYSDFLDTLVPFYKGIPGTGVFDAWRSAVKWVAGNELCGQPPNDRTPPFTGGQCPTQYIISYVISYNPIGSPTDIRTLTDTIFGYYGKIRYPFVKNPDPAAPALKSFYFYSGTAIDPDAQVENFLGGVNTSSFENITLTSFTATRQDGLPDTCGDPPVVIPPYDPDFFKGDTNITYVNNNNVTITVPVGFAVGIAYFDANLNFKIPVNFTFSPNFNISPTFKFDISANFNFNTGDFDIDIPVPTGDGPPTLPTPPDFDFNFPDVTVTLPDPPSDVPQPEPIVDKQPLKPVIRACVVKVLNDALQAEIGVLYQEGNPDVYIPDMGLINFQIQLKDGRTIWTEDIRVKNKYQFIICEWGGGAVGVRGTPRAGIDWAIYPVYSNPDAEFV